MPQRKTGYTRKELYRLGEQRLYSGETAREVAFPIGGIGTGSIALSGTGELVDWEIFNRPNKGSYLPNTFLLLWAQEPGREPVTKVLQAPPLPSYTGTVNADHGRYGDGLLGARGIGLPHMREGTFAGEYPFAHISFADPDIPLDVSLEAYNPFIPLNPDDSSIPVVILRVLLYNPGPRPVRATLAASLLNAVGYPGNGSFFTAEQGQTVNEFRREEGISWLHMTAAGLAEDDPRFGSMALATPWPEVSAQAYWQRSGWFDAMQLFWDEFSTAGTLQARVYDTPSAPGQRDAGALALHAEVPSGETVALPVYITWHFPNFLKYWGRAEATCEGAAARPIWRNYYASLWADAGAVARYVACNESRLYEETSRFHDALFGSTLPWYVLDAVSSQASILKTTTCLRLSDGTFYGFEGSCLQRGCCEGSCTHVWNYAQALPFLFPSLERSMREADYAHNQREDGRMAFRIGLPLGTSRWDFHPAADGQMGGIIKTYRDWKLSGDDAWLRALWPRVQKALEYAWVQWDADKDGVMEGIQHNTYDIEFLGPNTMMGSLYLGALRAAEEMALHLGEKGKAAEYRALYESGRARMEQMLYNGEYYVQKCDPAQAPKYQYGEGCLADQMIGQWMARLVGLGELFDPERVHSALKAIYQHNWKTDFWDHANCQRIYALNDEKGLLLCTWPRGERPALPFVYSDEVWCGIEYQVASHMIYEGLVDEGLAIVRGVRERHDGRRRNPWNEFECGSHYARSMASWSLLTALSGFSFDLTEQRIGFAPRFRPEKFRTFWSVSTGWGTYRQRTGAKSTCALHVAYGTLTLRRLDLCTIVDMGKAKVRLNGESVPFALGQAGVGCAILFAEPLKLQAGDTLRVRMLP